MSIEAHHGGRKGVQQGPSTGGYLQLKGRLKGKRPVMLSLATISIAVLTLSSCLSPAGSEENPRYRDA